MNATAVRRPLCRAAFTLVELLVVIAIIGILVALLLPAVQAAREAARRSQCSNNLKQLGLAMHNYHDINLKFPRSGYGGSDAGWNNWERFGVNFAILPYMEQINLFDQFSYTSGWAANYNGPMQVKLKTFLCPSAVPYPGGSASGWNGPGCNYGWCSGSSVSTAWGSGANSFNGMFQVREERAMADVTDGLSNTLMTSELLSGDAQTGAKYPYDIFFGGDGIYTSVVNKDFPTTAELTTIGTTCQAPVGERSNNGSLWAWYAHAQVLFNTATTPNWRYPSCGGNCCPGGAHDWGWGVVPPRSLHPGGVNAALGDASVRFISQTVDLTTFQRLGNRQDGQAIAGY